jgi:hypothetical protein
MQWALFLLFFWSATTNFPPVCYIQIALKTTLLPSYTKPIEIVTTIKLLCLNISNNLKWNHRIEEIVQKASTRLYFLRQLKRAKIAEKELFNFLHDYNCIRPITEYACPVFHLIIPKYLSDELERIQKRQCKLYSYMHAIMFFIRTKRISNE